MNHIDPMPYILAAGAVCFGLGYLAGRLHHRQPVARRPHRYGSVVRSAR